MRNRITRLWVGVSVWLAACTAQPLPTVTPVATIPLTPQTLTARPAAGPSTTPSATDAASTAVPTLGATLPLPTETASPTPTATSTLQHIVTAGETLFSIGLAYGVSVDDLRAANSLAGDVIYAGQTLIIPARGAADDGATRTPPPPTSYTGALAITALTLTQAMSGLDQPLVVTWTTSDAVSVTLQLQSLTGSPSTLQVNLPPNGRSTDATTGLYEGETVARLVAFGPDGRSVASEASLILPCRSAYFFTGSSTFLCPSGSVQFTSLAQQRFEQGWLLGDRGTLYALFDSGAAMDWGDLYHEGDPTPEPVTPPAGLFAPTRGFGLFWRTVAGARDGLGWATDPDPISFDSPVQGYATSQEIGRGFGLFYQLRDGRVVWLTGNTRVSRWAYVP